MWWLRLLLAVLASGVSLLGGYPVRAQRPHDTHPVFYVSKQGNNGDGRSWATAWNELDQIDWSAIGPGATILLDGGASGMRYTSTLTIGARGTAEKPIRIQIAEEAGRNGPVTIFGGRTTPLPYCGQRGYQGSNASARKAGVVFDGAQWVVLDGGRWRGITITGHAAWGIHLRSSAQHITVRNVEIVDNGTIRQRADGSYEPDQEGVNLGGSHITFERAIVHDNGQDAFQSGGINLFTLRQSWLYNGRKAPDGRAFNRCRHQDGIQIYNGGTLSGILIEESIFGPGLLQGTILGQTRDVNGNQATVNDVTIRHSLFYKADNVNIMGYPGIASQRWVLDHVTSYREPGARWHNVMLEGSGHTIRDSVFVGGSRMTLGQDGLRSSNNCQVELDGVQVGSGQVQFASISQDDYALRAVSGCTGAGSSITSVRQLLNLPDDAPPLPEPPPHTLSWEAEVGNIRPPFRVTEGAVVQPIETIDPQQGGVATYRFDLPDAGDYLLRLRVDAPHTGANSLWVAIDRVPQHPTDIWDVALTRGFDTRTVTQRGTSDQPETNRPPRVFALTAGSHTLTIIGRERGMRIDRIQLEPVEGTRAFAPRAVQTYTLFLPLIVAAEHDAAPQPAAPPVDEPAPADERSDLPEEALP